MVDRPNHLLITDTAETHLQHRGALHGVFAEQMGAGCNCSTYSQNSASLSE